jgi:hypothetical protein
MNHEQHRERAEGATLVAKGARQQSETPTVEAAGVPLNQPSRSSKKGSNNGQTY